MEPLIPSTSTGRRRLKEQTAEERSPIDSSVVIGRYSLAEETDVDDALAAAKAFAPEWEAWGWEKRRDLMLKAADIMESRAFEMAADMAYEIGKNRLEALGDIAETVEFFRYYANQITEHDGFVTPLGSSEPGGDQHLGASPLGGLGGDLTVQLPDGTGGRPRHRRPDHREHGGDQAVATGCADGPRVLLGDEGGRAPGVCASHRDR